MMIVLLIPMELLPVIEKMSLPQLQTAINFVVEEWKGNATGVREECPT
jgi:hypothetical protein